MNKKSILIIIIVLLFSFIGYTNFKNKRSENKQNIDNLQEVKDFELKNSNGDNVKLSDYKGKVIVLNFFATWCPPCKAELPGFVKMVNEYNGKDVVFVFIDVGEGEETVKSFLAANNYNFTPLMDYDSKVSGMYDVRGIPTTFIINKDFNIINQHVGFMDETTLKNLIDEVLK